MLGAYDFCGHYEWTFEWLRRQGGEPLVRRYWREAISIDAQRHAEALIGALGIEGMKRYWGHTLAEEAAGYSSTATERTYRIDMHDCPSKGFLVRNGLQQYHDYCDHCMGWIGPLCQRTGWVVDHEHNHRGQCWWELRRADDPTPPSGPGELAGSQDVRLGADWRPTDLPIDTYRRAQDPDEKSSR